MFTIVRQAAGGVVLAIMALAVPGLAVAGDDFPIAGSYTQNVACKGDGSDPAAAKVTISAKEIVSNVGVCAILDSRKDGDSYAAHVECQFPAGPLVGDIKFTPRSDNTVDFVDRDQTYKAVLYRCPSS